MLNPFTPISIKNMTVKNRIMRSATMENMADEDGFITDKLIKLYSDLANGGTGLIITGACAVEKNGKVWNRQTAAWDDQYINGLESIAAAIHGFGNDCKCAVQLHHGGLSSFGYSYGGNSSGFSLTDLTDEEIKNIIKAFGEGALRIKKAGFDAVAVHGAHGYLISQFMSPVTNNRTDHWGGNLNNRLRLAIEVCYAIKEKVGAAMPLLWKINCDDYIDGGQGLDEYLQAASKLANSGVDLIEVSGGVKDQIRLRARLKKQAGNSEAYFRHVVKPFKQAIGASALAITGGIRSLQIMGELLDEGLDLLGICRPLICEPNLPDNFQAVSKKVTAKCISCNKCLLSIANEPVKCMEFCK